MTNENPKALAGRQKIEYANTPALRLCIRLLCMIWARANMATSTGVIGRSSWLTTSAPYAGILQSWKLALMSTAKAGCRIARI
jgi:hypothetical protein